MEMAYGVGATVDIYPGGKKKDELKIFKNMTLTRVYVIGQDP